MGPSTSQTSRGGVLGASCRASVSWLVKLFVTCLPAFERARFSSDCFGVGTVAVATFLMGLLLQSRLLFDKGLLVHGCRGGVFAPTQQHFA